MPYFNVTGTVMAVSVDIAIDKLKEHFNAQTVYSIKRNNVKFMSRSNSFEVCKTWRGETLVYEYMFPLIHNKLYLL